MRDARGKPYRPWNPEHYRHEAHSPEAEGSESPTTAKERRAATVRTPERRALYARRNVNLEPVFGQIKEARGFRRLLLRGLANRLHTLILGQPPRRSGQCYL